MNFINQVYNQSIELDQWEQQEANQYSSGTPVEIKAKPDQIYTIEAYDPMMVPPIWLVGEAQPYYPEQLKLKTSFKKLISSGVSAA